MSDSDCIITRRGVFPRVSRRVVDDCSSDAKNSEMEVASCDAASDGGGSRQQCTERVECRRQAVRDRILRAGFVPRKIGWSRTEDAGSLRNGDGVGRTFSDFSSDDDTSIGSELDSVQSDLDSDDQVSGDDGSLVSEEDNDMLGGGERMGSDEERYISDGEELLSGVSGCGRVDRCVDVVSGRAGECAADTGVAFERLKESEDGGSASFRSRGFIFVCNNYTDAVEALVETIAVKSVYLIYGREVAPSTGTRHLQGYCYFKSPKTVGAFKKMFLPFKPHVQAAKGNSLQNEVYCKKDGSFFEHGVRPLTSVEKGVKESERWKVALDQAKAGLLEDIEPEVRFKHYSTCKSIMVDHQPMPEPIIGVTSTWIWGESGVGKSRWARFDAEQEGGGLYYKILNEYWDAYQGEKNVILEDVDPSNAAFLRRHLKVWCDIYGFGANVKFAFGKFRPRMIYITSQYHPHQIWGDRETRVAICRRMNIVHLAEAWAPPGEDVGVLPEYVPFCPEFGDFRGREF